MNKRARLGKLEKALEPAEPYNMFVVWSEEERQALYEKYGEEGWIEVNWEDPAQPGQEKEPEK